MPAEFIPEVRTVPPVAWMVPPPRSVAMALELAPAAVMLTLAESSYLPWTRLRASRVYEGRQALTLLNVGGSLQRSFQIRDDVLRRLDAYREPYQAVANPHPLPVFGRDVAVGAHDGVEHHTVNIA